MTIDTLPTPNPDALMFKLPDPLAIVGGGLQTVAVARAQGIGSLQRLLATAERRQGSLRIGQECPPRVGKADPAAHAVEQGYSQFLF